MVPLWRDEDLCLVHQPAERLRVDDPVSVALERCPDVGRGLVPLPTQSVIGTDCQRSEQLLLLLANARLERTGDRSRELTHEVKRSDRNRRDTCADSAETKRL
jgi:hypothetical protein